MLGHLIALYDRGIFEAARLMSNLVHQLAVTRGQNVSLIKQIGAADAFSIVVDEDTLSANMRSDAHYSPLISALIFGLRQAGPGDMRPAASWIPQIYRQSPVSGFALLSIEEWLGDKIIPTGEVMLSRGELVSFVRDKDGGAHSDPDVRFQKSMHYLDLVNSFPISKQSHVATPVSTTLAWEMLPPITHPMLRQIAHELFSAIYSNTDIAAILTPPPGLVCRFDGTSLQGAFEPPNYVRPSKTVYGRTPAVIPYPEQ